MNLEGYPLCICSLNKDNTEITCLNTLDLLHRIISNIIDNPNNGKYRRLKLQNAIVLEKLLPVAGAMECLFEMGFVEDNDSFILPMDVSLASLKRFRNLITRNKSSLEHQKKQAAGFSDSIRNVKMEKASFLPKLRSSMAHVKLYEDKNRQEKALRVIPFDMFQKNIKQYIEDNDRNDIDEKEKKDLLILELLSWFKLSFFSWMNSPSCECGAKTNAIGSTEPSPDDLKYGAHRVELYECNSCKMLVRFPRYNDPAKLLETRTGRCGEWANCFTLCCRALGFDSRYVLDWTDHVWTEVYSEKENRWIHCDPCENIRDKPLLYEKGWKKNLTYVIAFSHDDLQDVTWRYSVNHNETLSRRKECSEIWLVKEIWKLKDTIQSSLPKSRRDFLNRRCAAELGELMSELNTGNDENLGGRQSGSVAWRTARGEIGSSNLYSLGHVFKLSSDEILQKELYLSYSCSADLYIRGIKNPQETKGWHRLANTFSNIIRKIEMDWNMVYLARSEGSTDANITWIFDFKDSGLVINTVEIKADSTRFENGKIMWKICSDDQDAFLPPDGSKSMFTCFQGSNSLTISSHMNGGKDSNAWQHTQIFRQKVNEVECIPFEIKITFTV